MRLWRRRGHGIHSPYAYDFLRRVVAQPCSFYAFAELDRRARADGHSRRMGRLIYRLCLHVSPLPVHYSGKGAEALAHIVAELLPADVPRPVAGLPSVGEIGISTDQAIEKLVAVWDEMPSGQLFEGASAAILIGLPHLYHQKFSVWI